MLIETGHLSDADLGHQRHKIVVRTGEMAHMAAARGRNMSGAELQQRSSKVMDKRSLKSLL